METTQTQIVTESKTLYENVSGVSEDGNLKLKLIEDLH